MAEQWTPNRMSSPCNARSRPRIVLGSLAHDPEGRLLRPFELAAPTLNSVFDCIGIVVTPQTVEKWMEIARSLDHVVVIRSRHDEIGENRREALSLALSSGAGTIQYTDLDRIVHWATKRPSELKKIVAFTTRKPYTIIGRTNAALATHPPSQRLPEMVTNSAISTLLGKEVDITSGCCAMSLETAKKILRLSTAPGVTTDGEWPILAALVLGYDVGVVAVDGLDFETADYYTEEIQRTGGPEKWIRARYENLAAWDMRVAAANATIKVVASIAVQRSEG